MRHCHSAFMRNGGKLSHFHQPIAEGGLVGAHRDGDFFAVGEDGEALGDLDGVGVRFFLIR